jgi:trimethylamine--corrinoid protein Co-methyltransferase
MNLQSLSVDNPYYRILSTEDIDRLHGSTLEVLEEVGVTVTHPKGLDLLSSVGAHIDASRQRVRIPAYIIEKALASARSSFIMAGRSTENDINIDMNGELFSRNGGGPGHIEDLETGEVREARLADVRDYARLVNALDNIEIVAPIYAQDTPPGTRDIRVLTALLESTSKHINMRLLHQHSLKYIVKMAEIVAGSKENLRARPVITMLESPIAPLILPDVLVETLLVCGEYGIPVEICSMPIAGATGPITLAGSLLMSNVEMIASVAISQLANPGAPLIFTPRIMVMDMTSGYALTGSIENALLAAAGVQLAREAYQIPVNMHGPYTDSVLSDAQAGIENMYFTLLPAMAGVNILTGAGHLEGGLFVSFTQLMIDSEITGIVQRGLKRFPIDEETLGIDAISRSIVENNLLIDDHTMKHLRNRIVYQPKLMVRESRSTWIEKGAKSMRQRGREMAKDLLSRSETIPLEPYIKKSLKEVIDEAAQELE